ncbi:MAG: GlsB/YeaQ/YmgE family stress response rane protein [Proteobacteria bacterium]|nr:GlsB/YeaQ/YmgE family stress response rane protein [Pseudomonadota bacterium]
MRNLIGAVVSGLIVGVLARYFYPGPVPLGWIATILLGIGGSLAANLVATRGRMEDGINRPGCLASVLGAMALIFLIRHLH